MIIRLAACLAAAFLLLSPARAAQPLADCNAANFGKEFAGSDAGWSCVEIGRREAPLGGGGIIVRAVRDATTDPQLVTQQANEALDAAVKALTTYDGLGLGFEFANVTMVFINPEYTGKIAWRDKEGGILADANAVSFPTDCIVRIPTANIEAQSTDSVLLTLGNVVAHEAFHCVEGWTWREAATGEVAASALWWIEGAAEFFASLVFETTERAAMWGGAFEAGWTGDKPLTAMKYENVVFFTWLWSQGPATVKSFFDNLATYPGEQAQQNALEKALSDEQLEQFSHAYVDSKITVPSGAYVFAHNWGGPKTVSGDAELPYDRKPFQLERDVIVFKSGVYNVFGTGSLDWMVKGEGGDWKDLDPMEEIDACDKDVELKAVRLRKDKHPSQIRTTKQPKACEPCLTLKEKDKCVVGKWRLDGDQVIQMLNGWRKNEHVNYDSAAGSAYLVFDQNGNMQAVFEDFRIGASVVHETDGEPLQSTINISITGIDNSRWSTEATQLASCKESQDIEILTRVEIEGVAETEVRDTGMMANMTFAYACMGDVLALEYQGDTGEHEKPRWQLNRVP